MANVRGAGNVIRNLQKAQERMVNAVATGLYLEGNNHMGISKRRVPVDLGALKGSGYVTLPEVTATDVTVELGYGGPAKKYAIVQHERLDYNHPDGGQAKYLESVVDERRNSILSNVAALAKRAFDRHQKPQRTNIPTTPDEGEGVSR